MGVRTRSSAQTGKAREFEQFTLSDLLQALTLPQMAALISLLLAILGGAYGLGVFTESKRGEISDISQAKALADEQALNRSLQTDLQLSKAENSSLERKILDNKIRFEEITGIIKRLELEARANEGEIEFLNRFLSYIRAPSDASKSTFVDYVCALWKNAQSQRIHFEKEPLANFNLPLDPSVSSELRNLLLNSGISAETISKSLNPGTKIVRVGPFDVRKETDSEVNSAKIQINRVIKSATLVKIVRFADGRSFEIPPEVAIIVHTKPSCSPM